MEEKVFAKHPDKTKQGVRISRAKYEIVREAMIQTIRAAGEITFSDLLDQLEDKLEGNFDGSIPWYVTTVKLDLEARGMIERAPKSKPQRIRLNARARK